MATLTNLSATYLELGEYELAAATANRALEENAAWRKGYHRMGVAYEKMGKKREAMEICVVKRAPLELIGSLITCTRID